LFYVKPPLFVAEHDPFPVGAGHRCSGPALTDGLAARPSAVSSIQRSKMYLGWEGMNQRMVFSGLQGLEGIAIKMIKSMVSL